MEVSGVELIEKLGLWKWLIMFLVISLTPVVNSLIRDSVKSKREKATHGLLMDIREILYLRYTQNISLSMCEALLQPILDNSSCCLVNQGRDILRNNNLQKKNVIEASVRRIVNNMWSQNNSWLSHFYYHGHRIDGMVNESWKEELIQTFIQGIYNAELYAGDRGVKNFEHNIRTEFENIRFNTLIKLQGL